ncbi:MAG: ABC transporter ATP-binding protein [Phycisphaerae bacterium]
MDLRAENVSFSYGGWRIIDSLSFACPSGAIMSVTGPNGTGKSTLLRLVMGLLEPESGRFTCGETSLEGMPTEQIASLLSYVPQEYIPAFGYSVFDTVLMARTEHFNRFGFESAQDRDIVMRMLEITETNHLANRTIDTISGGERQRVFIARALARQKPVILLDEPTSFLDMRYQVQIFDILKRLQQQEDKTIIVVVHEVNLAIQYADVSLMFDGAGGFLTGTPDEIFTPDNIRRCYRANPQWANIGGVNLCIPAGENSRIVEAQRFAPE